MNVSPVPPGDSLLKLTGNLVISVGEEISVRSENQHFYSKKVSIRVVRNEMS